MDVGDNIGGGSSADSTYVLAEAKRLKVKGYLQTLYDPECVQLCIKAGVGASLILEVGGKTDSFHGDPVPISGTIRTLFDGKFEDDGPTHGGFRFYDGGPTAVLDTDDEHTLVLTSLRCGNTSREQMYSAGVAPERYRVILAKGVVSPRPAYAPIAQEIVLVNSPGITTSDLSFFQYNRRRRKLYPFEETAHY
jgi:microcystin degradation protein MlrC